MGNLNLPPSSSTPRVSSLLQGTQAQPARAVEQTSKPAEATKAANPAKPMAQDQVVSRGLQNGQATQALAFVEQTQPPTQAEIQWAGALEKKIEAGYKPTPAECQAYHKIADQLEASLPVPRTKPIETPVSAHECQWALGLEEKVRSGKPASAQELASYKNIAYRLLKADQSPVPSASVSRQELDWAVNLQKRVKVFGYTPSPEELKTYEDIYKRQNAPEPAPKVTPEQLDWAKQLYQHIQQGYKPTEAEQKRYTEIYVASQATAEEKVSNDETRWALDLGNKVQQGYRPTEAELARYGDISRRLALQDPDGIRPEDEVVSQHELDWAAQLQQRIKTGIPASDEELQRYENIYKRYPADTPASSSR
ncbi:MAG: hypothetical protein ACAI44_31570 [Candidatus Sericytochromatia bacterium]